MDSFFKKNDSADTKEHQQPQHPAHHQASNSDLLSSAKFLADAAKSTFNHESGKVDKGRAAGAAEDLLGAAERYAKLEDNKYLDKAQNYLHQYHTSHSTTTTTNESGHTTTTTTDTKTESHSGGGAPQGHGKSDSQGGYGDYLKMAGDFLKK